MFSAEATGTHGLCFHLNNDTLARITFGYWFGFLNYVIPFHRLRFVMILKENIKDRTAWIGAELLKDDSWLHEVTDAEISSLDRALAQVKASGKPFPDFTQEDFYTPEMVSTLSDLREELENGYGFKVMRGLPVAQYSEEDIKIIYYGIGLNLGIPVRQNPKGDLLGTVMNVGDLNDKSTRVYETNAYLPYHTDPSDVVGLLCIRKAMMGGVSSLISVASVYNQILVEHPDILEVLYRPWYYAHLGEDLPTPSPLFSFHQGKLAFRYLRQYIELGHEMMNVPLSADQCKALDILDTVANQEHLRLDMLMEPGDLQWANNYAIMHSRTSFEDSDDLEKRRKKLRLWLKMPNARKLAPDFPGRNGFSTV